MKNFTTEEKKIIDQAITIIESHTVPDVFPEHVPQPDLVKNLLKLKLACIESPCSFSFLMDYGEKGYVQNPIGSGQVIE